jgi:hypothetical protein
MRELQSTILDQDQLREAYEKPRFVHVHFLYEGLFRDYWNPTRILMRFSIPDVPKSIRTQGTRLLQIQDHGKEIPLLDLLEGFVECLVRNRGALVTFL